MPAPLAKGIIIAVSVIAAAGIAAYESRQVQEWIRQFREKTAIALHSLGDDIHPRPRSPRSSDASMREDASDEAEARRRRARQEIMERGRLMQERQRRRRSGDQESKRGSFDTLVDRDGVLRRDEEDEVARSTAVENQKEDQKLIDRHHGTMPLQTPVDAPVALRPLEIHPEPTQAPSDPFESTYAQEMHSAWNCPPAQPQSAPSSQASDGLIDYAATSSEAPPDPDFSVPDSTHLMHPLDRSQYFSANTSASSHASSRDEPDYYYAHPENPFQPLPPHITRPTRLEMPSVSSAPSIDGSTDHIGASEFDESSDGVMSEFGDGIRTPASAWTEVDSLISSDAGH